MYKRAIFHTLLKRIQEPRRFIQVLAGPRQVGKTTMARQLTEAVSIPVHFVTADEPTLRDRTPDGLFPIFHRHLDSRANRQPKGCHGLQIVIFC